MQVVAEASPNIALVKYWGKRPGPQNLPATGSISITLDALRASTSVAVAEADSLTINDQIDERASARASACVEELRQRLGASSRVRVSSDVNFPVAAGLASSAAGFAALTVAVNRLFGGDLDTLALARIAGHASGSAARSLYGGFVELTAPESDEDDIGVDRLAPAGHWPLAVAIAVTESGQKPLASGDAMRLTAATSPYYRAWIDTQTADLDQARRAIERRDFEQLADVAEVNCLKMHASMLAARPGIVYFRPATLAAIEQVRRLRRRGTAVFFTIDAGPQVKAVCEPADLAEVVAELAAVDGVRNVLTAGLGDGARLVQ